MMDTKQAQVEEVLAQAGDRLTEMTKTEYEKVVPEFARQQVNDVKAKELRKGDRFTWGPKSECLELVLLRQADAGSRIELTVKDWDAEGDITWDIQVPGGRKFNVLRSMETEASCRLRTRARAADEVLDAIRKAPGRIVEAAQAFAAKVQEHPEDMHYVLRWHAEDVVKKQAVQQCWVGVGQWMENGTLEPLAALKAAHAEIARELLEYGVDDSSSCAMTRAVERQKYEGKRAFVRDYRVQFWIASDKE